MESLAVKYRPQTFKEVCSQKSIIQILERQLELKQVKNCYLFCGPSGTGKTTLARIFANAINHGEGKPIEIDAASNNGVDNIREIVSSASERSLNSEYKVIILDEVHMLTTQSWNAFLKCVEEPPQYTIFIFCTTDPQKIPATILNRVQKFNLAKIPTIEIKNRLIYVCKQEGFTNFNDSVDYIAKLANGGMRDALAYLDKAKDYSTDLSIGNVINALGTFSYEVMFDLTNSIIDGATNKCISILETTYNSGFDMKLFVEQYLDFALDLLKYCVFASMSLTKIPNNLEDSVKYATGLENNTAYYTKLLDKILDIKNTIKYDTNIKNTVEVMFINLCRGV